MTTQQKKRQIKIEIEKLKKQNKKLSSIFSYKANKITELKKQIMENNLVYKGGKNNESNS